MKQNTRYYIAFTVAIILFALFKEIAARYRRKPLESLEDEEVNDPRFLDR